MTLTQILARECRIFVGSRCCSEILYLFYIDARCDGAEVSIPSHEREKELPIDGHDGMSVQYVVSNMAFK